MQPTVIQVELTGQGFWTVFAPYVGTLGAFAVLAITLRVQGRRERTRARRERIDANRREQREACREFIYAVYRSYPDLSLLLTPSPSDAYGATTVITSINAFYESITRAGAYLTPALSIAIGSQGILTRLDICDGCIKKMRRSMFAYIQSMNLGPDESEAIRASRQEAEQARRELEVAVEDLQEFAIANLAPTIAVESYHARFPWSVEP